MSLDTIAKINQLPPDKQKEVEDFVDFLTLKYHLQGAEKPIEPKNRLKLMGRMKGKIWMADDFNTTPEDFKDYC